MKKEEREKLEKEARAMYAQRMSLYNIAKKLNVATRTLGRWKEKYKWDSFVAEVDKKVSENLLESVSEMKSRHIKIIKATIAKYIDGIMSGDTKVSASEAAKMLQHELELISPKQISQYNFKKEVNMNVNLPELLRAIRAGEGI